MKINIITLGCSKNIVDSEHVAGHLRKAGFTLYFDRAKTDCDIVIVNTCGFIGDAKEESVDMLLEQSEIKRRGRKHRELYAIGCLVERYRDQLAKELPDIDAWYGVHQWKELIDNLIRKNAEQLEADKNRMGQQHAFDYLESQRLQSTPRHYAYLKIAEGCNRSCSYCAIPGIRGPHVSRPIEELVEEAQTLVQNGAKELIVIAQDTTYYGMDLYGERRLGALLEQLASLSGASWIRLHYTYPASFPDDAIEAIRRHDNICKYIDIPLQHINTQILNSMRRGINREDTLALLRRMRERIPGVAIRTTLITGYPGEGETEFEELKAFVRDARFERMGVFAYSPEEDTPAYVLGDPVDDETKARRIDELMAIQEDISLEINQSRIGKQMPVILDRKEAGHWIGRTQYDSPEIDDEVLITINDRNANLHPGDIITAEITDAYEHDLTAVIVEE